MKLVTASVSALALSCGLAFAQTSTSPGSTAPGATAPGSTAPGFGAPSTGSSTTAPPGSSAVAPPGTPPPAGSFAPSPGVPNAGAPGSPPNPFTTGSGSGQGQSPQDLTRRYNRQDQTRPGASNPQDLSSGSGSLITPNVPSIIAPER